jgi:putative FmdB family regulatory protein
MPIYEYSCKSCEEKFEKLVRTMSEREAIACPQCGSTKTARALSVFAVGAESSGKSSSAGTEGPGMCGRCGGPGPCAMG